MLSLKQQVRTIEGVDINALGEDVLQSQEPLILKGLVSDWPLVQQAQRGDDAFCEYLLQHYSGQPITAYYGAPEIEGRIFYNDDMSGFNFSPASVSLGQLIEKLRQHKDDNQPPTLYMGSTSVPMWFPKLMAENPLGVEQLNPLVSLWFGNKSRIAAHFDFPDNIACVVAGRRKFTLFPPEQVKNLYIGPLDFTPAGQAISLVDFNAPDLEKYPRFVKALAHAQVAELEPGDALFIPSMWWHHVESLSDINALVNYWWRSTPSYLGNPADALNHALLSIAQLPANQKQAWQNIFEQFVFNDDEDAHNHIPQQRKGTLGDIDPVQAKRLRAQLLNKLNR
ncbi:cupin-like domain-containing protein [Pseudoalteromonas sp. SSDWG2]|uniref:cupin-like domain-containing protein n=1 Tax=Pseudoalteromonas sp. SSDWG2 TaxID=3139391 RepID=UPI003BAA0AA8